MLATYTTMPIPTYKRIKSARVAFDAFCAELQISNNEIATRLGYTPSQVYYLRKGVRNVNRNTVLRIKDAFPNHKIVETLLDILDGKPAAE